MHYDQKFLVCNAYPSHNAISILKNGADALTSDADSLPFRDCRYLQGDLKKGDELEFALADVDSHGTFKVGDLPANDAILLVVVEKRPKSPMVAFQSYAIPTPQGHKEAQIAVIDAVPKEDDPESVKLLLEDHVDPKEAQTVAKRIEHLSYNRVYSVEEGSYDASIMKNSTKAINLVGQQNYVLLRTGSNGFETSLVVFPSEVAPKPGMVQYIKDSAKSFFAKVFRH